MPGNGFKLVFHLKVPEYLFRGQSPGKSLHIPFQNICSASLNIKILRHYLCSLLISQGLIGRSISNNKFGSTLTGVKQFLFFSFLCLCLKFIIYINS